MAIVAGCEGTGRDLRIPPVKDKLQGSKTVATFVAFVIVYHLPVRS
jgi:hypothetical protein